MAPAPATVPPARRIPETRVTELACYRVAIPADGGTYAMSGDPHYTEYHSTVVRVTAEDGTCGFGEASTMGGDYLDGFVESAEAAVRKLAPIVLASDPLQAGPLVSAMDHAVIGHYPGKAAIDIAMWDLRARLLGVPVGALLGGIAQTVVPAFCAVPVDTVGAMVSEAKRLAERGYVRWQIKVGDDPDQDAEHVRAVLEVIPEGRRYLSCDANRGWTTGQAVRFARAIADVDTYLEQPCSSITELAQVRAATGRPIVIDEAAKQPRDLLDAIALGCADAINIKPVRVGGLTKAALMRDIAQAAGMMMTIDEPQGQSLATASIAQLAATVDPSRLLAVSFFGDENQFSGDMAPSADPGVPTFAGAQVTVPTGPGLCVVPDELSLGEPLVVVAAA